VKVRLTDRFLRNFTTESAREEVWDTNFSGAAFGVRVTRKGRKTFVLMYRQNGKLRRISLGTYPQLELSDARKKARKYLGEIAAGDDPVEKRKGRTFGELADKFIRYYPRQRGLKPGTVREYERILRVELLPAWENLPAKSIRRGDVNTLLDHIAFDRNAPVLANRTLALASVIFNFGIDSDHYGIEFNPCARIRKRVIEKPRERFLSDEEIRTLWAELDNRAPITRSIYRLILLTAQRSGEVKIMRWDQIEGDVWTIPGEITKNGRIHRVPLSPQTLRVLEDLRPVTGHRDYVFPSRVGGAVQWLQKNTKRLQDAVRFHFTPHDLRRTASTVMSRLGVNDSTIGRVLNHSWAFENMTAKVYNRDDRLPEKRRALEKLGNYIERIVTGEAARVVKIG